MNAPIRAIPRTKVEARNPALDGLRGIAVLLVLFDHFTLDGMNGAVGPILRGLSQLGWTGVDLFFVLSGFLITGILHDAKGADHYFRNFYARRSVRIFPAYFLLIAMMIVLRHV